MVYQFCYVTITIKNSVASTKFHLEDVIFGLEEFLKVSQVLKS